MAQERVILCMKWGTLYSAAYVNVLYRACRANMTGDFRFVCMTDDKDGIEAPVECYDIPEMELTDFQWYKGGWPKLNAFAADLYGLTGQALFIDLDTIICGPLDDLFAQGKDIWVLDTSKNWQDPNAGATPLAGTGLFSFTLGAHPYILDDFVADPMDAERKYRIEQIYLEAKSPDLKFWPSEYVLSFKYHLRRPIGVGMVLPPKAPPASARAIAFHGEPRPIDLVRPGWWGIAPNIGRGGVTWAKDYWFGHGGD